MCNDEGPVIATMEKPTRGEGISMAVTEQEWTPPASDHELNKRLADAIGLEIIEATYNSSKHVDGTGWLTEQVISWRIVDDMGFWSPASDWNQAMRCAEVASKKGWHWCVSNEATDVCNRLSNGSVVIFDLDLEDEQDALVSFCHVILQALEYSE